MKYSAASYNAAAVGLLFFVRVLWNIFFGQRHVIRTFFFILVDKQYIDAQHDRADHQTCVRHIEHPEVDDAEIEKISHIPKRDPVDQVAERAAERERQR